MTKMTQLFIAFHFWSTSGIDPNPLNATEKEWGWLFNLSFYIYYFPGHK